MNVARLRLFKRPTFPGNLPVSLRLEASPAKAATPGRPNGAPAAPPFGPLPVHA